MKHSYKKIFLLPSLFILSSLMLGGCGWHLRGLDHKNAIPKKTIYISTDNKLIIYENFKDALKNEIENNGDNVSTIKKSDIEIKIKNIKKVKYLFNKTNQALNEYKLTYSVKYSAFKINSKDKPVVLEVTKSKNVIENITKQMSANYNKENIYKELRLNVINQIIAKLQTIK